MRKTLTSGTADVVRSGALRARVREGRSGHVAAIVAPGRLGGRMMSPHHHGRRRMVVVVVVVVVIARRFRLRPAVGEDEPSGGGLVHGRAKEPLIAPVTAQIERLLLEAVGLDLVSQWRRWRRLGGGRRIEGASVLLEMGLEAVLLAGRQRSEGASGRAEWEPGQLIQRRVVMMVVVEERVVQVEQSRPVEPVMMSRGGGGGCCGGSGCRFRRSKSGEGGRRERDAKILAVSVLKREEEENKFLVFHLAGQVAFSFSSPL